MEVWFLFTVFWHTPEHVEPKTIYAAEYTSQEECIDQAVYLTDEYGGPLLTYHCIKDE